MDEADVFVLHQSGLASSHLLTLATMRESGAMCDVIIHVKNHSFQAHRSILAAGIPYFASMFMMNVKESVDKEISMQDVDPLALELLINFTYTNKLKITKSNAVSLFKTSLYLQLDYVSDACIKYIVKYCDPDSVLPIYINFDVPVEVLKKFRSYIIENFNSVSMSKEFLKLSYPSLKEFICRDDLNVKSEKAVFEAVMRWIGASESDRKAYLPDLLLHVRMPLLSPEYLLFNVQEETLIHSSPVCRKIVSEAVMHHTSSKAKSKTAFTTQKRCGQISQSRNCNLLYAVFHTEKLKTSIKCYDPTIEKWSLLHNGESLGLCEYFACTEERMYFFGGRFVGALHLETQELTSLECNGRFPMSAGVALHEHLVYFFGGECNSTMVSSYDLNHGTINFLGHMAHKRLLPGVASSGNIIFITGGCSRLYVSRSGEMYDLGEGMFSDLRSMSIRRFGHGCAALNGKIYVCGGRTCASTPNSFTCTSEVYDPKINSWVSIAKPSNITGYVSLVSYANKLHAIPARNEESGHVDEQVYEPEENTWKSSKIIPDAHNYRYLIALVSNSASYLKDIPDSVNCKAAHLTSYRSWEVDSVSNSVHSDDDEASSERRYAPSGRQYVPGRRYAPSEHESEHSSDNEYAPYSEHEGEASSEHEAVSDHEWW